MAIDRQQFARELLMLRQRYAPHKPRDDEICLLLREDCRGGDPFHIVLANLGEIGVTPPRDKYCTGEEQVLVVDKFLILPAPERKKLIKLGIVKVQEVWKPAYGGQVRVKLF